MNQDQNYLQTVKRGVERLRQGIPFSFNSVQFNILFEENLLSVSAFTSWLDMTIETAAGDINRAQTTYWFLTNEFAEFAAAVVGLQPRFSVIEDIGQCYVELAYLSGNDIVLR